MWFACHRKPQLAIPVLFLTLHACLFSVQIKYRSFVLVEDRCYFFTPVTHIHPHAGTHTTDRGSIDAWCWYDSLLKRKSSQYDWSLLWGALFLSSILQGIFVSQHCEIFFFSLFVCSRERVFPLSVLFVSVTVLITNCLIFQLIENWDTVWFSFCLAVGLW